MVEPTWLICSQISEGNIRDIDTIPTTIGSGDYYRESYNWILDSMFNSMMR